jgi:hypothetical protein
MLFSTASSARLESICLAPVVMFDLALQVLQRGSYRLDKIETTRSNPSDRDNSIPLGEVVCNHQHFAIITKTVRYALDNVIRGLSSAREQHLHFRTRFELGRARGRSRPIKNHRHWCSNRIAILRQPKKQFLARGRRVPRFSRGKLRPAMQQAITVDQNSDWHIGNLADESSLEKANFPDLVISSLTFILQYICINALFDIE